VIGVIDLRSWPYAALFLMAAVGLAIVFAFVGSMIRKTWRRPTHRDEDA
jgi:hypothetical protein